MKNSKDIINEILQEQEQKEKTNIKAWKKSTKFNAICVICNKEFEFEVTPKNQYEAIDWNRKWNLPKRYFCSDKCKAIHEENEYQKRLKIFPKKFRSIECDKKDLIKQGINESIFITGASGVGKTVLMAGIAKEILKNKGKVKWVSYPSFIMELQSMYGKKDNEKTPFEMAEDIAAFPDTLCIDDIGAEKMTAFVQQITYYIINYREQEMLHTLITSNFSLQQIDEQIDSRISSRIAGMCKVIKIISHDRRLDGKKADRKLIKGGK